MLWRSVVKIFTFIGSVSCLVRQNNVCPTLEDYRTMFSNKKCSYNPDIGSSPRLISKRYGYPFENHQVTTQDGYILNLHRIPGPRNTITDLPQKRKTPVFIVHGIAASSAFWILSGKKSLAFILADNGYDVWMANLRGNYYSPKHVNPTISERDYWNFGLEEMSIYDIPASIDYIANQIGEKGNLIYIGHSMGTTLSYIYATEKRQHAEENVKAIISLAPVVYMKHTKGTFGIFAPYTTLITNLLKSNGLFAIGQNFRLQRALIGSTCGRYPLIFLCTFALEVTAGAVPEQFRPELLPVFLSFYPAAVSLKTFEHFSQLITSGKFQKYDYGPQKNMEVYNSTIPPEYVVEQVTLPVHLFVGDKDPIGNLQDEVILEAKLRSRHGTVTTRRDLPFAHQDFFLGKDLSSFYTQLLQVLDSIS